MEGARLQRARLALGLTRQAVADLAGAPPSVLYWAENVGGPMTSGARQRVRRALLAALAARRRWRRSDVGTPLGAAVRALLAAGDADLATWLAAARRERLRDVLWGVTAHALSRHASAHAEGPAGTPEALAMEALGALEETIGRFRGPEEDALFALPNGGFPVWSPPDGSLAGPLPFGDPVPHLVRVGRQA